MGRHGRLTLHWRRDAAERIPAGLLPHVAGYDPEAGEILIVLPFVHGREDHEERPPQRRGSRDSVVRLLCPANAERCRKMVAWVERSPDGLVWMIDGGWWPLSELAALGVAPAHCPRHGYGVVSGVLTFDPTAAGGTVILPVTWTTGPTEPGA